MANRTPISIALLAAIALVFTFHRALGGQSAQSSSNAGTSRPSFDVASAREWWP